MFLKSDAYEEPDQVRARILTQAQTMIDIQKSNAYADSSALIYGARSCLSS